MSARRRLAGVMIALLLAMIGSIAAVAAPASAATRDVGSVNSVEGRCNSSPYLLCLYWYGNRTGAYWGTSSYTANLSCCTFFAGTGAGSGSVVRNNAAGMSCDTSSLWCWSYVSPNRGGNIDYLRPQWSGTLFYTWNNEASVDVF